MGIIKTIFNKECRAYFGSPIAYIYIITFIIFMNWYFFRSFFLIGQATMRPFFDLAPWVLLFLVPAISMRSWAEEKRSGTLDFLFTFPIKDIELVIGKFAASVVLLLITICGTLPIVIVVCTLGSPDIGPIITGYIGLFLLATSFLSIGFFISACTKNQIIAFILSIVVCFFSYILSQSIMLYAVPEFMVPLFRALSLGAHYESISKGIIDTKDVFFYFSIIGFFLYCNTQMLESRKIKQ